MPVPIIPADLDDAMSDGYRATRIMFTSTVVVGRYLRRLQERHVAGGAALLVLPEEFLFVMGRTIWLAELNVRCRLIKVGEAVSLDRVEFIENVTPFQFARLDHWYKVIDTMEAIWHVEASTINSLCYLSDESTFFEYLVENTVFRELIMMASDATWYRAIRMLHGGQINGTMLRLPFLHEAAAHAYLQAKQAAYRTLIPALNTEHAIT